MRDPGRLDAGEDDPAFGPDQRRRRRRVRASAKAQHACAKRDAPGRSREHDRVRRRYSQDPRYVMLVRATEGSQHDLFVQSMQVIVYV
jgi:hypothetical protein